MLSSHIIKKFEKKIQEFIEDDLLKHVPFRIDSYIIVRLAGSGEEQQQIYEEIKSIINGKAEIEFFPFMEAIRIIASDSDESEAFMGDLCKLYKKNRSRTRFTYNETSIQNRFGLPNYNSGQMLRLKADGGLSIISPTTTLRIKNEIAQQESKEKEVRKKIKLAVKEQELREAKERELKEQQAKAILREQERQAEQKEIEDLHKDADKLIASEKANELKINADVNAVKPAPPTYDEQHKDKIVLVEDRKSPIPVYEDEKPEPEQKPKPPTYLESTRHKEVKTEHYSQPTPSYKDIAGVGLFGNGKKLKRNKKKRNEHNKMNHLKNKQEKLNKQRFKKR